MVIMAPADENECRQMLFTGIQHDGPSAVRYPRGNGPGADVDNTMQALDIGRAEVRHQGSRVALLAFGTMVAPALDIGIKNNYTVVNMRFVKPLDTALLDSIAESHDLIITIEENAIAGGAGAGVMEYLSFVSVTTPVRVIGLPDEYVDHGSREELLSYCKLDVVGITEQVEHYIEAQDKLRQAAG